MGIEVKENLDWHLGEGLGSLKHPEDSHYCISFSLFSPGITLIQGRDN